MVWCPANWKPLTGYLDPGAIAVVLSQFTSSLRTERIAEAMIDSTARIFDLIRAIKDYSYMDQMPIQEVDIPQGLENTLAMLASRLRQVDSDPRLRTEPAFRQRVWPGTQPGVDRVDRKRFGCGAE